MHKNTKKNLAEEKKKLRLRHEALSNYDFY